jgi:hypothetical protein
MEQAKKRLIAKTIEEEIRQNAEFDKLQPNDYFAMFVKELKKDLDFVNRTPLMDFHKRTELYYTGIIGATALPYPIFEEVAKHYIRF